MRVESGNSIRLRAGKSSGDFSLEINGRRINGVRRVRILDAFDDVAIVKIEMLASKIDADLEGFVVEVEPYPPPLESEGVQP